MRSQQCRCWPQGSWPSNQRARYSEVWPRAFSPVSLYPDAKGPLSSIVKVRHASVRYAAGLHKTHDQRVMQVYSHSSSPNYFQPWQNKQARESRGSGFAIAGRLVLTNAHVVADQTFVHLRKYSSPHKFAAKVLAVGHDCDLALLTVDDERFWADVQPLEFGDVPELQHSVAVAGYPQGGDNISITTGVVSRIDIQQYVHGAAHLLAIQIDAAINPGNSGGALDGLPFMMLGCVCTRAHARRAGADGS